MLCLENILMWFKLSLALATLTIISCRFCRNMLSAETFHPVQKTFYIIQKSSRPGNVLSSAVKVLSSAVKVLYSAVKVLSSAENMLNSREVQISRIFPNWSELKQCRQS